MGREFNSPPSGPPTTRAARRRAGKRSKSIVCELSSDSRDAARDRRKSRDRVGLTWCGRRLPRVFPTSLRSFCRGRAYSKTGLKPVSIALFSTTGIVRSWLPSLVHVRSYETRSSCRGIPDVWVRESMIIRIDRLLKQNFIIAIVNNG